MTRQIEPVSGAGCPGRHRAPPRAPGLRQGLFIALCCVVAALKPQPIALTPPKGGSHSLPSTSSAPAWGWGSVWPQHHGAERHPPPGFPSPFSPLPLSPQPQAHRDPKEGSPHPEPLSPGAAPGKCRAEPFAGHEHVHLLQAASSQPSPLFWEGRKGVSIPSPHWAGSRGERCPPHQPPALLPAHQLYYIFTTNPRWWHLPADISDL